MVPTPPQALPGPLTREDVDQVIDLAKEAGDAILEIYEDAEGVEVDRKADDSPLTEADLASHRTLVEGLEQLPVGIPILSEEAAEGIDHDTRKNWARFWLVDPLDGTKEFVKRNGEFTVNVALVEDGQPALGIVHLPAEDRTFVAVPGEDAYALGDGTRHVLEAEPPHPDEPVKVVVSRSHLNQATEDYVQRIEDEGREVELVRAGSALKFTRIAEGAAHLYPRLAPTMEWDTAAAQAVLEAAGGTVVRAEDGEPVPDPLVYNKDELTNPHFVAAASEDLLRLG
jgi:3'(2'), 5'-bisphosphate nucleotidase